VVFWGATLFITNRRKPKGGVFIATSRLISIINVNRTPLYPKEDTIGINIGMVIIMIATASMKVPRIRMTICIIIMRNMGDIFKPEAKLTSPEVAPEKASN
jgi:hypothetical protein